MEKKLSEKQATEIADTLIKTKQVLANNDYKKPDESRAKHKDKAQPKQMNQCENVIVLVIHF